MALDDLVFVSNGGDTTVTFAPGVHTISGYAVAVEITLVGVVGLTAQAFSFGNPALAWGIPSLDTGLSLL